MALNKFSGENEDDGTIDLADPNDFSFIRQETTYNHQGLVMRAAQKVQDALAQEMREGFWDTKIDNRGNSIKILLPDTRKVAIECIDTLKNTMIADLLNTDYEKKINEIQEAIIKEHDKLLDEQKKWYDGMDREMKQDYLKNNPEFISNKFSDKSPFYHLYLNKKVEFYREIWEQLNLCIAFITKYYKKVSKGN